MEKTRNKVILAAVNSRIMISKIFIILFFMVAIFSAPKIQPHSLLAASMHWLGCLFITICVLGRIYCSILIAGKKTLELIQTGPFSLVRNPLYVFSFIGMIGIAMQFTIITIPVLLAVVFCVYYPKVVSVEEQRLNAMFGQSFEEYKKQVPRWLPRTLKMKMVDSIETNPKIILKSMRDASMFFLSVPAFALLAFLHQTILPTLWQLW